MSEIDPETRKKLIAWQKNSAGRNKADLSLASEPELLDLIVNSPEPGRVLELAFDLCSKNLRKDQGTFYTPFFVAEKMVKRAFFFWQKKHGSYKDLCQIKVLDPACGAGEFLLAALFVLLEKHRQYTPQRSTGEIIEYIVRHNLYGIDCNGNALELLRCRLRQISETDAGEHIVQSDSLSQKNAGKIFKTGEKFNIVIGNPPYVSYGLRNTGKIDRVQAEKLRKRFAFSAQYKISLYALFMEFAINSTAENGIQSFIVPDSFLCGQYFEKLRIFMLKNCTFKQISLIDKKLFKAVAGKFVIYFSSKTPAAETSRFPVQLLEENAVFDLEKTSYDMLQDEFKNNFRHRFRLFFSGSVHSRVLQIEQQSVCKLGDLLTLASGIVARGGKNSIIADSPQDTGCWQRGIISSKEVKANMPVIWQGKYINCHPNAVKSGLGKIDYSLNKILIRQTGDRIIAAVDYNKLLVMNNLHVGISKVENLDLERLTEYLNSSEMLFYYQAITLEKDRPLAQTDLETLRELPMKEFFRKISCC